MQSNTVTPSAGEETPLMEMNGIEYFYLKQKHVEELHPILAAAFTEEPIGKMCEINTMAHTNMAFDMQLKLMAPVIVDNELSVVAIEKETGKVCGGFTSMDNDMSQIPVSVFFKMIPLIYKSM